MKKIVNVISLLLLCMVFFPGISASAKVDESKVLKKLQELSNDNPELEEYVKYYDFRHDKNYVIDLEDATKEETVPLFLQWDKRWGYREYGGGLMGYTGCGPTCMSMVAIFLTKKVEYTPLYLAQMAMEKGYYEAGSGTSWYFFSDACKKLGLVSETITIDEKAIKKALDDGKILICSVRPGDFTNGGHIMVIRGYDKEGFLINDPNSQEKSEKVWAPDKFVAQIKKIWGYKLAE